MMSRASRQLVFGELAARGRGPPRPPARPRAPRRARAPHHVTPATKNRERAVTMVPRVCKTTREEIHCSLAPHLSPREERSTLTRERRKLLKNSRQSHATVGGSRPRAEREGAAGGSPIKNRRPPTRVLLADHRLLACTLTTSAMVEKSRSRRLRARRACQFAASKS
jgi:hypothetical protein